MKTKSIVLSLVMTGALSAWAADDEMQTDIKGGGMKSTLPAENNAKLPPPVKPPSASDFKLRAAVRKRAPFWIDDKTHGAAIRINKDGTYSSEAQGGGSIAGNWKVLNGQLHLSTNDGGEKYAYPIKDAKGGVLTIRGVMIAKGRCRLH